MKDLRILSVIGARPQFVKAAVFRRYCDQIGINETLIHTGQHYDKNMSVNIFEELEVRAPDVSFVINNRTHAGMTGELMIKIENAIAELEPSIVNVYGDTNSTLAASLAASKMNIPIMHIEAGLRSFNRVMPEEVNRVITDHVSNYLFCPTFTSVKNLEKEGIKTNVHHVGDIMYDAIKVFEDKFILPKSEILSQPKPIALMTIHRAETISDKSKLKKVVEFCREFLHEYFVIFPVHPNTRNKLVEFGIEIGDIHSIQPLSYLETQGMLKKAELVLTDSGGMQKEAYFHGVECITLRSETEWVETIRSGWNSLWIHKRTDQKTKIHEYGIGDTCEKIFSVLEKEVL